MVIILTVILCLLPLAGLIALMTAGFKINIIPVLVACLLGLVAILPISIVQYWLPIVPFLRKPYLFNSLIRSIVVYGFIEELFKMFLILPIKKRDFTLRDYFFLSLVFGLSLGCFETIIYFLDHLQKSQMTGAVLLYVPILQRMVTSDLIHTFCAGLLGIFVYRMKEKNCHISLMIWAVCLHGLYDFFAGFQNEFRYFSIAVVLFAVIECRVKYQKYRE